MEDPPHFALFEQRFLPGKNPFLELEDEFLRKHTKVLLRSNASERMWKVKLDGDKLADGWEEFAGDSKFRNGDVLVFRHDGDENFHVSVSSRSSSGELEQSSHSYVDIEDDDGSEEDGDGSDEDDDGSEDDVGNISMKNQKQEAGSSSGHSRFFTAHVTRYNLLKDRLDLARKFTKVWFGEHYKESEIDLVNKQGRKWTLILAKNSSSGVFYIRRGWSNFCSANGLRLGDSCEFELVGNGERPTLLLCSQKSGNDHEEECTEVVAVKKTYSSGGGSCSKESPSSFLPLELTPNRYKTGQLYLSSRFTRENGIDKPGKITLLNKDGRKWSSDLRKTGDNGHGNEWFYLRKGWREMCDANGVKVHDSFVLELIWEDANPMFKFHSKIENHQSNRNENRRTRKKRACEGDLLARTAEKTPKVEIEGRTRVSNRHTATNPRKLQRTQPKSCSVSDQVSNVKESLVETLNALTQCRSVLETRERKLKAALLEIDALGESILGINHILNNKLV